MLTVQTLTEWGQILAPDGQGRIFLSGWVWFFPQTRQTPSQTDWNLISSNSLSVLVSVLVLMVIQSIFRRRDPSRLKKRVFQNH